jgi:hypothetical protein
VEHWFVFAGIFGEFTRFCSTWNTKISTGLQKASSRNPTLAASRYLVENV